MADLQVNGTRLQLNRLPVSLVKDVADVHHSLSESFVSELEELNYPSASASAPPPASGSAEEEHQQEDAHSTSFRHRPIPVQIQYPPVRTSPSSSPSRGWIPTSAGQFDHETHLPHTFLHAHTGVLAYTKPNEPTHSSHSHVSPPRLRPSRSRSRSHSRSRSQSRSAVNSRSISPAAQMTKHKHEFLRAHTGGHAHPDLPMHYASIHAEEEEESKQEVESSTILELMDDIPQAQSQRQQPQPIHMPDLKPVSPTRYPFHHVGAPTPAVVATHAIMPKPVNPHQLSSKAPPGSAPGTLTAYIQRFRNQPPRPSASRQALPPMWWMHPSNQSPPAVNVTSSHGPSIPALNLPVSTADQLRAMEIHIEQQKSERQRRKEEQTRQQQQQQQTHYQPQIDEAKKQQHQHNIVQLAKELNAGTSLSQDSLDDESKEDMGYSLSAESFSALDALDHNNALVPSPRQEDAPTDIQAQNMSAVNTSMMGSLYNSETDAAPRQPKNSILDDSDDFSALLPSATGTNVESDLPLPVPRASLHPRAQHQISVRPNGVDIASALASTQDVDDLLSKWRAAHRPKPQQPASSLHHPRPLVQSSRSHRFDHTPSPPRGRTSAREPENSPEVDKLISRLKRRLGLNESAAADSNDEKENEDVATSIQHLEEARQKLRETLSARQSSRRECPSGTPFINPASTRPSSVMPLEKVLQQPKVAEKDYIDSARRVAQEDSKNTPPSSTAAHKSEFHCLPTEPASTQAIVPPLKLPMQEASASPQRSVLRTADSDAGYSVLSSARSLLDSDRQSPEHSARPPQAPLEFSLQPVMNHKELKSEQQRNNESRAPRRSKKKQESHHRDRFLPPKISIHISPASLHPMSLPVAPPVSFTANMEPITTAHPAEPRAIPLPVVDALPVSQGAAHEVLASPVRSHPSSVAGSPLPSTHSEQQRHHHSAEPLSYQTETMMQETNSPPHKPRSGVRRSVLGEEEDEVEEEKKEEPEARVLNDQNGNSSTGNEVVEAVVAPIVSAVSAAVAAPAAPTVAAPVAAASPLAYPSQPFDVAALQQQMINAQFAFAMAMQQQAAQMAWNPMLGGMMHGLSPYPAAVVAAQPYPFYPAQPSPVPVFPPAQQQHSVAPFSPSPNELNRLCAELGMTVEEYYADPPLQLLVQQLARLQAQELQAQQINAAMQAQPHHPTMTVSK